MWDTVEINKEHLSHDMPCHRCGHAAHTFLACSDTCQCVPAPAPGYSTQNSFPSGSAMTTQLTSPWPMSTRVAPSEISLSTSAA